MSDFTQVTQFFVALGIFINIKNKPKYSILKYKFYRYILYMYKGSKWEKNVAFVHAEFLFSDYCFIMFF